MKTFLLTTNNWIMIKARNNNNLKKSILAQIINMKIKKYKMRRQKKTLNNKIKKKLQILKKQTLIIKLIVVITNKVKLWLNFSKKISNTQYKD